MKILMVNKFLHPNGGSETYIFKLGEELQKRGHDVQYFGMEHEGRIVGNRAGSYTSDMDFHTGKLQKLVYPFKIIYSFEAKRRISRVLKDMNPDVVHLNNINFQLTPSVIYAVRAYEKKAGRRIKLVYTAHDYQWVCPNHMMRIPATGRICFDCRGGCFGACSKNRCIHNSRIKSLLGTVEARFYMRRQTYGMVDVIICPSEFMKRQLDTNPLLEEKTVMMRNLSLIHSPFCDVIPCNGMEKKAVMGNLREQSWDELWNSEQAEKVRACTRKCDRNCWMIGSASPAMHKYIWVPGWWVIRHKFLKGGKYSLKENKYIGRK